MTAVASYAYDAFGNLKKYGVFSFQPSGFNTRNQPIGPFFDAAGYPASDFQGNQFLWDAEGRLSLIWCTA